MSRAQRLAIVHYTAPPVVGGVETIVGEHSRQLERRGHDVRVIAGSGDCERVPELDSRHRLVEHVTRALADGRPCADAFGLLRARIAGQLTPLLGDRDLAIVHNVFTMPFNLPLAHALVDAGLPLVAWTHDLAWNDPDYARYRRAGYPCDLMHRPQPGTTYVAISRVRQREVASTLGLKPSAVPVIPNGIEAPSGDLSRRTQEILRQAGCGQGWPLVLLPVRITPRKRIELAVGVAALLREHYPRLRLVVTGPPALHNIDDRTYAARLKSQQRELDLEDTVCFLHDLGEEGQHLVDELVMADLYRLADCVLLTSESEGFGIPAIEAGMARVPLVAPDIEVLREITGGAAYLYPADSGPDAVAPMLERAFADPVIRLSRHVANRHDWHRIVDVIEDVIEDAVGSAVDRRETRESSLV